MKWICSFPFTGLPAGGGAGAVAVGVGALGGGAGPEGPGDIKAGRTDAAVRARPSKMLRWWSLLLISFSPPTLRGDYFRLVLG